jgi:outer membrane protein assembly factor BamB
VDKNAEWKTPIDGKGWSSPIVVGDQLILTSAKANDRGGQDLHVHALDKRAGKILWNTKVFSKSSGEVGKMHAKNSYASPTAVSDGKLIIVHFGHMGTACLDPLGKILWQTEKYKYDPQHGNGNSPILVDKNVVFSCDGNDQQFLVALDLATGKEVWKTHRNTNARLKFSFATAQLIEHQGQRQIISPASDFVAAYDPANGKELWRVKYPVAGWSVIPRPVYGEGLVFICTGYVTQHVMAIDPSGTGDVTSTHVKWTSRKFAPNTPTPLLVGTELYTISDQGTMSCYDAKTGKVHWAERLRGKAFSASPIYSDGKIYITSEDGIGQVIAADKTKLEILQINDMKEKTFATLVPDNGALYLRTESALFKFVDKK